MKRLFIVRHAKSSWKDKSVEDIYRKISSRGKRDIKKIALWLKSNGYIPDLILSSPAKRAQKSAKKIVKYMELPKDIIKYNDSIYEASVKDLISIIKDVDSGVKDLFIIGHNPSLNELAEYLTDSVIFNIPTSGVFCIKFDMNDWKSIDKKRGEILFFEYPKKLEEIK